MDKKPRQYIKDGKHKNIKNLTEYKTIQQKIDCSISSYNYNSTFDKTSKLEDYFDDIRNYHKEFLEKHNLIIKNKKLNQMKL